MLDLVFRYASGDDVPEVVALVERAYRGPEATTGWTTESHLLTGPRTRAAEIERIVATPDSRFVLAESGAVLVGCALVQRVGDGAYFGMFAVDPRRQAGGIGKALLAACEDSARDLWSARAMTMSVISLRADLIEWYVRRGYQRVGTSEPFPFHEASGALRTDFDLVHLSKRL
ncbi:MAG: GNAT family N-acetyltransferase [Nocardioidaceae bacterium]